MPCRTGLSRARLVASPAAFLPPPPPGAVRAHHHAHPECGGEALRLPPGLSHLPVILHADVGHPLLKFLRPGK